MSVLQDPEKALEQVEWYLEHRDEERFPGAIELAAGNLCRQTLEQILFILCFFSGMPKSCYLRSDRTIQTAGRLLRELDKLDASTGKQYWALARKRGPRIRKWARSPRVFRTWQRDLNEPSHYSAKFRKIDELWIRNFVRRIRQLIDDKDKYLLVAAINELFSNGMFQATLASDPKNTPGVCRRVVVGPQNIERDERGGIRLNSPKQEMLLLSDNSIPRGRWPRKLVLVQHCIGMHFGIQFVTKRGDPVNISSMATVLESLAKTSGQKAALTRRLRKLGFEVSWDSSRQRD
jgi:hypothetical protein